MISKIFVFFTILGLRVWGGFEDFAKSQRGVTAIEYALIAVAISTMLFLVLGTGGEDGLISRIKDSFRSIQDGLSISKQQSK
ncbi:Flp family type IVb pilin [Helicobacter sp. 11S02596-1]|uniref:Flp family type IVb pilin n=1 Tax=Helicobacter sp. 11S02596-1 TaxID=1476194 RepID=UPI000BA60AEB|nr:Flp family type IVb pilin [Helicobacter sp. 11S02596-1]PAF43639.1 hypothetical protein BJI48_05125 [Helicobacter sp. 11S02596-1]